MDGIPISSGIALGRALKLEEGKSRIEKKSVESLPKEIEKFNRALDKTLNEIEEIYKKALSSVGKKEAEIFNAHKMMVQDPEYVNQIVNTISNEQVNSEFAVEKVSQQYISIFENMDDDYMRERALDLKDISERLISNILGTSSNPLSDVEEGSIIVAKELTPSDTSQIDRRKIEGFITKQGGKTSHTSIIARTLDIPAVSKVDIDKINTGDYIIIDGNTGKVFVNPDIDVWKKYKEDYAMEKDSKKLLKNIIGKDSITKDGFKVELAANIGGPKDLDLVIENDGEGIGLYRTEFMYMDRDSLPSEDEQFHSYKIVAEKMGNKPVIIRTLDVGGDKDLPYLNLPEELNPFLGYRAIRISLDREELFKTQLRAILRASAFGKIKIMFPMISNLHELRQAKSVLNRCMEELKLEGKDFDRTIEVGIMVEIPSVAINGDFFAKEVDFFSIGTNDLIQYTLAVDRGNEYISHLYDQFNPAVLRLIKMTIDSGHRAGIWVGMCGEAAGDPSLIPIFLAMGLDEFSMNPTSILGARNIIRSSSKKELEKHLEIILNLDTGCKVKDYIDKKM